MCLFVGGCVCVFACVFAWFVCACVVHLKCYSQGILSINWSFKITQTAALPFDVVLLWFWGVTYDHPCNYIVGYLDIILH